MNKGVSAGLSLDSGNLLSTIINIVLLAGLLAVFVILIIRLSRSLSVAAENNARINQYLAAIPSQKIGNIEAIYSNTKKELGMALLLALSSGWLGTHKLYMGEKKSALLFLIFCWTGIPFIISLFNAVGMPKTVSEYNLNIIESLYNQLAAPQVES